MTQLYRSLADAQRIILATLQILTQPCSLLPYSKWLGHGSNLNSLELINGYKNVEYY